MKQIILIWQVILDWISGHRAQFAYSARVTIAASLSFTVGKLLSGPLAFWPVLTARLVLWPVLTAIILTQLSVGKSVKAIVDYFIGTFGGGVYAALVVLLIPHARDLILGHSLIHSSFDGIGHSHLITMSIPQGNRLSLAFTLVIVLAPLAFLAALYPRFSAAPFTGALVVFIPTVSDVGPLASAFDRILEVMLGGVIALIVSIVIFPARSHVQVKTGAAKMLEFMAQVLPELFVSLTSNPEVKALQDIQHRIGELFIQLNTIVAEAKHERITLLTTSADAETLLRALLRLRHDFIMVGRAALTPFPSIFRERLGPLVSRISIMTADHLRACAQALTTGSMPAVTGDFDEVFKKYSEEMVRIRAEGVLKECALDAVEHIFTLSFALEQLHQNVHDLEARVMEHIDLPGKAGSKEKTFPRGFLFPS